MRDYIVSFKRHQLRADQLLPSTCINIGQHTKTFKRGFRGLKLTYTAITTIISLPQACWNHLFSLEQSSEQIYSKSLMICQMRCNYSSSIEVEMPMKKMTLKEDE